MTEQNHLPTPAQSAPDCVAATALADRIELAKIALIVEGCDEGGYYETTEQLEIDDRYLIAQALRAIAAQPPAAPIETDDLVEVVIACCNGQMGRDAAIEVISELRLAGFEIVPAASYARSSAGTVEAKIDRAHLADFLLCYGDFGTNEAASKQGALKCADALLALPAFGARTDSDAGCGRAIIEPWAVDERHWATKAEERTMGFPAMAANPVKAMISNEEYCGKRAAEFTMVSCDLIRRISDYFHVNAKPSDDLAQGYMRELDAMILADDLPGAPQTVEVTDEMVNAAAREMWNDLHAARGGPWESRGEKEVVVVQFRATARAAINAALSLSRPNLGGTDG